MNFKIFKNEERIIRTKITDKLIHTFTQICRMTNEKSESGIDNEVFSVVLIKQETEPGNNTSTVHG